MRRNRFAGGSLNQTVAVLVCVLGSPPLGAQPAQATHELTFTLFGKTGHLYLSVGTLGLAVIVMLLVLLAVAVAFAVAARLRASEANAAKRKLEIEIVERKRGEQSLRESEERTRLIVDTALDAVITMDGQGVVSGWNPRAEAIFGWTSQEAVGQALREMIIPAQYREQHQQGLERYLASGEAVVLGKRIELTALHRDGREFPVELAITRIPVDERVSFSAFVRDITERKQADQKLQAQLARLDLLSRTTRAIGERQDLTSILQVVIRSLEEHLPIDFGCVCLCDDMRDSLTVAHVGLGNQPLGFELAIANQSRIDIDQNGLSRCLQGHLVYEPDIRESQFPFSQRLARGGLRSVVFAPLQVESNIFGVMVAARRQPHSFDSVDCEFLRQLSEHVALAAHQARLNDALQRAYEDLRQTQRAAMQQERLRAVGQMASGIAHDINNAISPAALYIESILENEPDISPRIRDNLMTVGHAIDDVAATVARMREFYRQREPESMQAPVDLNRLAQQVVELTRARWSDMEQRRGVVIEMRPEFAPDLPAVMGAESEIREALTNLIFNAVDAMPDGGTLTLRSHVRERASGPDSATAFQYVDLEVVDTGIGMDEDTRLRCLEPFFTTKGERGTGLGLAMVYGTMRRHNAAIEIESRVGKGTTIRLSFPIPATVGSAQTDLKTAPIVPLGLRILVVDDDPLVLKSLRDTLERDGHDVVTANGGQAGIDVFRAALEGSERFTVVITDLGMPYVDGRKVAAYVKDASASTPVILLTGWGRRLTAAGDTLPHIDRVLSKPPKLSELREALAACCRTALE